VAIGVGSGVAWAGLDHNPANSRFLIDKPLENYRYDYASECRSNPPKGMRAFEKWMRQNVRGESWGIMRCHAAAKGRVATAPEPSGVLARSLGE